MFDDMPFSVPPEIEETKTENIDILGRARDYALLFAERKELEEQVDDIKAKMAAIEMEIAETMMLENPKIRVKVGERPDGSPLFKTVHVSTTIRASHAGDKEALIEAMKASGLEPMISETFNANTLSAYVRGLDPDKKLTTEELMEEVPEEMRPYLKLTKTISLGCKA